MYALEATLVYLLLFKYVYIIFFYLISSPTFFSHEAMIFSLAGMFCQ